MGVVVQCMLSREVPGCPKMEGKSLAAAFCGQARDPGDVAPEPTNVVTLRFGNLGMQSSSAAEPAFEPLLAPLDKFIAGDRGFEWHEASTGLVSVRNILERLHGGAKVSLATDFEFIDADDEEITNGVIRDLKDLEKILTVAEQAGARFYLAFGI